CARSTRAQPIPPGGCIYGEAPAAYCDDGDPCTDAVCQPPFCHLQSPCPVIGTCGQVLTSKVGADGTACRSVAVPDTLMACSVITDGLRRTVERLTGKARSELTRAAGASAIAAKRYERRADRTLARLRAKVGRAVGRAKMDTGCGSALTGS